MRMMPAEQASPRAASAPQTQLTGLWLTTTRVAWVFLLLANVCGLQLSLSVLAHDLSPFDALCCLHFFELF